MAKIAVCVPCLEERNNTRVGVSAMSRWDVSVWDGVMSALFMMFLTVAIHRYSCYLQEFTWLNVVAIQFKNKAPTGTAIL